MSTNFRASNPRRRKKRSRSKKPRKTKAKVITKKRKRPRSGKLSHRKKKLIIRRKKQRVTVRGKKKRPVKRVSSKKKRLVKRVPPKKKPLKKRKKKRVTKPEPERFTAPTFEVFAGSMFFNVEGRSYDYVVRFVYLFLQAGVKWFRFIRRIPGGMTYDQRTGMDYFSTRWTNFRGYSLAKIKGFVGGLMVPGVEELVQVVIRERDLPPGIVRRRSRS